MKVKICGITNINDALFAVECGADFIGFLFAKESPRYIEPASAKGIIDMLPAGIGKVGLFKDTAKEEVVEQVKLSGIDHIQLHGSETPEYCTQIKRALLHEGIEIKIMKTFKVKDSVMGGPAENYFDADYYLFDTFHPKMMGGTGLKFNWKILKDLSWDRPVFIAGGLTPGNVAKAVSMLEPYGVDIASGVEKSVGKKDDLKIKEFIRNAKEK
jgi:phosphoribosylanthranilate isomerase